LERLLQRVMQLTSSGGFLAKRALVSSTAMPDSPPNLHSESAQDGRLDSRSSASEPGQDSRLDSRSGERQREAIVERLLRQGSARAAVSQHRGQLGGSLRDAVDKSCSSNKPANIACGSWSQGSHRVAARPCLSARNMSAPRESVGVTDSGSEERSGAGHRRVQLPTLGS